MNFRVIAKYIGKILMFEGLFMAQSIPLAVFYKEYESIMPFVWGVLACEIFGYALSKVKQNDRGIYAKEGYLSVALGWLVLSVFGTIPFILSGYIPNFIDAFFEVVSGFTTTGASILTDVEVISKSILYWRSFTHWVGGMGVLVFLMAIVPMSNTKGGGEGLQLMRAESPGPSISKMTPTLKDTARVLYAIYIGMTVALIVILIITGMPVYDSFVTVFGTAGTGGFGIKSDSMASYSYLTQFVVAIGMMLFGVNFSIHYLVLSRKFSDAFKNEELRCYIGVIIAATLFIFFNILKEYNNLGIAMLDSFFSVSTIITTTGFSTANFDLWPEFSRFILVLLMICGASAGSTGGGLKISRLIILFKTVKREIFSVIHPNRVKSIMMDGKRISETVVKNTLAYFAAYWFIAGASMFLISFIDGYNTEVTITAVMACLNNIGPGLDLIGPAGNYAIFSPLSKIVLSLNMLIGRLEIWPMLLLFAPSTYKRK